jgi:nitroreductase
MLSAWLAARRWRRATEAYVASLMVEPDAHDVEWLSDVATGGDDDHARWELRYARRALGMLVAQRDALNDRTPSAILRELSRVMLADRAVDATRVKLVEQQFNDRFRAYREMAALRGAKDGEPERLGRAMLMLAGAPRVVAEDLARASQVVTAMEREANAALVAAYGPARQVEAPALN